MNADQVDRVTASMGMNLGSRVFWHGGSGGWPWVAVTEEFLPYPEEGMLKVSSPEAGALLASLLNLAYAAGAVHVGTEAAARLCGGLLTRALGDDPALIHKPAAPKAPAPAYVVSPGRAIFSGPTVEGLAASVEPRWCVSGPGLGQPHPALEADSKVTASEIAALMNSAYRVGARRAECYIAAAMESR